MIVLTVISLGLVLYIYSFQCLNAPISNGMRWSLGACRAGFLFLLLYLLTQPHIREVSNVISPPTLYIALDDSLSMSYPSDPPGSSGKTGVSRWETVLRELKDRGLIDGWRRKGFQTRFIELSKTRSGADTQEAWSSQLPESATPAYAHTDLASAIDRFTEAVVPNEPACLLLFTDGRWNQGRNPLAAAAQLASTTRSLRLPLYTFGIGTVVAVRDIIVDNIQLPAVARSGEQIQLRGHLLVRGAEPGTAFTVRLRGETGEGDPILEQEQSVALPKEGSDIAATFDLPSLEPGPYTFTLQADPMPGEWIESNNILSRGIQIRDAKDRVLILTSAPDWELKYLKRALEDQATLLVQTYLQHENGLTRLGDREWIERQNSGAVAGEEDYRTLDDLVPELPRWPAVVLHNYSFAVDQLEFIRALKNYTENGGGLIFIPGSNNEGMLPPTLREALPAPVSGAFPRMGQAALVRFSPESDSPYLAMGKEIPELDLPPLGSIAAARSLSEGGQVLLTGMVGTSEIVPLVSLYRYGLGRIVVMGSNSFWRWNLLTGRNVLTPFWLTSLYQASPRLQSQSGEIQTDGFLYTAFDPVTITYRAGGRIGEATESSVVLNVKGPSRIENVWLVPSGDQPNVLEARYTPVEPGEYRIATLSQDASAEFRVDPTTVELHDLRQNAEDLRELARLTGGEYANQPAWRSLAERLPMDAKTIREERSRFLGEKWWMAVLLILFLGGEWYLRWRKGLP